MFYGEGGEQRGSGGGRPKDLEKRAKVVEELGKGRSGAAIARELGVSTQRIGQIKKEEVGLQPRGKQLIYEKAREAGQQPKEYVSGLVSQKRPEVAGKDIGVSAVTLRRTMKDMGVRSTAPSQMSEQGRQNIAESTRKRFTKIPEDHIPRIAEKLEKGQGTQTLYAHQYETTQAALSKRLNRASLYSGNRGRPKQ